jgi:hypothetical protein
VAVIISRGPQRQAKIAFPHARDGYAGQVSCRSWRSRQQAG